MFSEFSSKSLSERESLVLQKLKTNKKQLESLLSLPNPNFQNFVRPYQQMQTELGDLVTEISHLNSVQNSEETQTVYSRLLPILSEYYTDLGQSEALYQRFQNITKEDKNLSTDAKKVLDNELRDFRLSGVGLEEEQKEKLKQIRIQLSELSNQFSQNVLNATNAYSIQVSAEDVEGLPNSDLEMAKQEDGTYRFSLQFPSYIAYMTYGKNREIRKQMYDAYVTRAPENGALLERILKLRNEESQVLGFKHYAEESLETKVAESPDQVLEFLQKLANKAKPIATKEFQQLQAFAKSLGIDSLAPWDMMFVSEKWKQSSLSYEEEQIRPYLEKENVVKGTFLFLENLLGIQFRPVSTKVWHPTVLVYDLHIEGQPRARLYLDLEVRKEKKGGAWMHNWTPHYKDSTGNTNLPIAFVVSSFPSSKPNMPSLLRPSDVVTLFHELGHALHHLLSTVDEPFVSGVNGVEWDAVEFPSQFLENFAYEPKVLRMFAKHHITGEILPDELVQKMVDSKNFLSAMGVVRQLEFALFDMRIHMGITSEAKVQEILDQVRAEVSVVPSVPYNKFQNSFTHIFAGGYAAGYYSYKWAELLSANAYYSFIDKGVFDLAHAEMFRKTILEKGGSASAMELFRNFFGKDPDVDALLRLNGIAA